MSTLQDLNGPEGQPGGQTTKVQHLPQVPDANSPFRVAEFSALREEILKHIDVLYQLQVLAIVIAGTLITVGLQGNAGFGAAVLFMYPILAAFLAVSFSGHAQTIGGIADYIRTNVEAYAVGEGWETYLLTNRKRTRSLVIATNGIFLTAELGAIALGVSRLVNVLVFTTKASSSTQSDLQSVHSLMLPLAILLSLDLVASVVTLRALRG